MRDDPLECDPMSDEMMSREFAIRVVNVGGVLWYQQRMRDPADRLVWVFLRSVDVPS